VLLHQHAAAGAGEVLLQLVHQLEPVVEGLVVDAGGQLRVARHLVGVADGKRGVAVAQEAVADQPQAAADGDERRQVHVLRRDLLRQGGADVREADAAGRGVAGVQLVDGTRVGALAVGHGPDEGDVVHLGRHVGPALGDPDAAGGGRDVGGRPAVGVAGLGVERLELARPALHEHQDHVLVLLLELLGVLGQDVLQAEVAYPGRAEADLTQERPPAGHLTVAVGLHVHQRLKRHACILKRVLCLCSVASLLAR